MVKRVIRFLLAFEAADGSMNVAEFGSHEEMASFQKELNPQFRQKILNPRELTLPTYQEANFIDMRD